MKLLLDRNGKPKGGYAGMPGRGPAGETCGSCKWFVRLEYQKTYFKCALTQSASAATDIRKTAPSCQIWGKPE